ncbi:MAG: hypothetical protein JW828_15245, partial [Sedimentisphaerales bacterium]|nr:hypothetical protein [Sedimentisphaerales bacterium]
MKKLILVMMLCLGLASVAPVLAGTVTYERWTSYPSGAELGTVGTDPEGITATNAAWLAANAPVVQQINVFQMDEPALDNYAGRITGWLIPPSDGDYTFWLTSDDDSRLWLSSGDDPANKSMICYIDGWCGWGDFDRFDPVTLQPTGAGGGGGVGLQKSAVKTLVAGKAYWLQVVYSDGTGGGFGRVNWEGPVGARQDITADYLRNVPWGAINPTPADKATEVGLGVQPLSWEAAQPSGDPIASFKVYFGEDPNIVDNPVLGTTTELTIDTSELVNNKTYYWMVQSIVDEANFVDGSVWSFATEDWGPEITQQPANATFAPACQVTVTIAAQNKNPEQGGEITYTWYKVGDVNPVGTGDTLVTGDAGDYYCVVANDIREETSNTIKISPALQSLTSQDIGTPTAAGNAYIDDVTGQVVVTGDGDDIWNAADSFHFAYKEVSGNIDIIAKIDSMSGGSNEWRKFGVMIRDELTTGSRHAYMAATGNQGARWQGRRDPDTGNNGNAPATGGFPTAWSDASPYWVRLVRNGETNQFTAYVSLNGVDWTLATQNDAGGGGETILNPHTFAMTDPVYVGLAVTSHESGALTTARFSNVTLNGADMFATPWDVVNVTANADPSTGWVDYDGDAVLSWGYSMFTPCDSVFKVYVTQDGDLINDPNIGDFVAPVETTDLTVTLTDAEYGFEHDQTWYYRIDVDSEAGG